MVESWAHLHKLAYEDQERMMLISIANEDWISANEDLVNWLISSLNELRIVTIHPGFVLVESWAHLHKLAYEDQERTLIGAANEDPISANEDFVN